MLEFNYDENADVMYITFYKEASTSIEMGNGIIFRYSMYDKNKLTGITIMDYSIVVRKD